MPLRAAPAAGPRSHRGVLGSHSRRGGPGRQGSPLYAPAAPPSPCAQPHHSCPHPPPAVASPACERARGPPSPRCLSSPNCETGTGMARWPEGDGCGGLPAPALAGGPSDGDCVFKCNTWPPASCCPPTPRAHAITGLAPSTRAPWSRPRSRHTQPPPRPAPRGGSSPQRRGAGDAGVRPGRRRDECTGSRGSSPLRAPRP